MPDYFVTLYKGKEKIEDVITARTPSDANNKATKKYPGYVVNQLLNATKKL